MTASPDRGKSTRTNGWSGNLRFRFALVFAFALLPVGLIAVLQGLSGLDAARDRALSDVAADTYRAAGSVLSAVQEAQGVASALAQAVPLIAADPEACSDVMRGIMQPDSRFSFVGHVSGSGRTSCSTAGRLVDFSDTAVFRRTNNDPDPQFFISANPQVSTSSVMGVTHPVRDATGRLDGYAAVSIPHADLLPFVDNSGSAKPVALITFDNTGTILSTSDGFDGLGQKLPASRNLASLVGEAEQAFYAQSLSGAELLYSLVPLLPNELYALGVWELEAVNASGGPRGVIQVLALPVAMWLASLLVAWFSVEKIINRYIRALKTSMTSFASGSRIVGDLHFEGAPTELLDVVEAYRTMTDTILHDEAELEDMVHQKEVLLREVHHRVKNNLQLIASIINMQMRREKQPEVKAVMKGLQDRVMTLATIHRDLYQTSGTADVNASELLSDIVRQIVSMSTADDRRFHVSTSFDDIIMTPDQAVPLSLFLTEALNNALKYAGSSTKSPPVLTVGLRRLDGGQAELVVENSMSPDPDGRANPSLTERSGLGSQLLQAFAHQIGGELVHAVDDHTHSLRVSFPLKVVATAEERHSDASAVNWDQSGASGVWKA